MQVEAQLWTLGNSTPRSPPPAHLNLSLCLWTSSFSSPVLSHAEPFLLSDSFLTRTQSHLSGSLGLWLSVSACLSLLLSLSASVSAALSIPCSPGDTGFSSPHPSGSSPFLGAASSDTGALRGRMRALPWGGSREDWLAGVGFQGQALWSHVWEHRTSPHSADLHFRAPSFSHLLSAIHLLDHQLFSLQSPASLRTPPSLTALSPLFLHRPPLCSTPTAHFSPRSFSSSSRSPSPLMSLLLLGHSPHTQPPFPTGLSY